MTISVVVSCSASPLEVLRAGMLLGVKCVSLNFQRRGSGKKLILRPAVEAEKYKSVRILSVDSFLTLRMRWGVIARAKVTYIVFVHDPHRSEYDVPEVGNKFLSSSVELPDLLDYAVSLSFTVDQPPTPVRSDLDDIIKSEHKISIVHLLTTKLYTIRIKENRDKLRKELFCFIGGTVKTLPSDLHLYPPIHALITSPSVKTLQKAITLARKVGPEEASSATGIDKFDISYILAASKQ